MDPSEQRTCAGPSPTTTEVDLVSIVDGSDLPGGASLDGDTQMDISVPTDFAPGNDAESGHPPNIEFFLNPNNGTDDELFVSGGTGVDNWELGSTGFNWNAAADVASPDSEMVLSNPTLFDEISINTSGGDDFVAALGGLATGSPLDGPEELSFLGGSENDVVVGGNGDDFLGGEEGNDTMQGFAGNDRLRGFTGNDFYGGGAGSDTAVYSSSPVGVNVNLGQASAQETGEGSDTLNSVENLLGSNQDDNLIGSDGPNNVSGGTGSDLVDGRGGDDTLFGGELGFDDNAADTVTYAAAPAAVSVNLSTGTATGGAGTDTLNGLEGLTGSPFADTLIGNALANPITGLAGSDTVSALGGPDAVDVRDGEADTASCGSEIDTATADRASVDSVNADCETIDFLPEPDQGGGGGGGETDTEISFDLTGKAKQRIVKQKGVIVQASCPLESCTATASGKGKVPKPKGRAPRAKLILKPVTAAVDAGIAERIKLPLKKKALKQVKAALEAGKRPKVTVSTSVTDASGNQATDALTVKATR